MSCEEEPIYLKKGWTESKFNPETIEMSKGTINEVPIISSKESLEKALGKPLEIKFECSKISYYPTQETKNYDCWVYEPNFGMAFQIDGEKSFLGYCNFEMKNFKVETPQVNLTKNTKIKDLKKVFPNSYAHRNIGANYPPSEGYEWMYLIDDLSKERKSSPNKIELIFKDKYLYALHYQWHPIYDESQWKVYQDEKKKHINLNK